MNTFSLCAIVVLIPFVIFYLFAKYKQRYWARCGVYSPSANWFFGHFKNTLLMRTAVWDDLNHLSNSIDDIGDDTPVGFYIMQKPHLLLRNLDHIKAIFVKDFHIFSDRYFGCDRKTDPFGLQGLVGARNPKWKYLRSKITRHMSPTKMKSNVDIVIRSAKNLRNYLAKELPFEKSASINIHEALTTYSADIIIQFTTNIVINSFLKENSDLIRRVSSPFKDGIINTLQWIFNFFYPELNEIFGLLLFGNQTEYFRQFFWEIINVRKTSGLKKDDLIDTLISLKEQSQKGSEYEITDDELVSQIAAIIIAGIELNASITMFTLIELAKNQNIQDKVREEIKEKIGNKELTYECILEMKYIQQVVSETLRMYPTLPFVNRIASNDYKLLDSNIIIQQGMSVYVDIRGIHYNPKYHINPLKYDPERFNDTRKKSIKPFTYIPFGIGPRMCIAERFGNLIVITALITILKEYEVLDNIKFASEKRNGSTFVVPSERTTLYLKKTE